MQLFFIFICFSRVDRYLQSACNLPSMEMAHTHTNQHLGVFQSNFTLVLKRFLFICSKQLHPLFNLPQAKVRTKVINFWMCVDFLSFPCALFRSSIFFQMRERDKDYVRINQSYKIQRILRIRYSQLQSIITY